MNNGFFPRETSTPKSEINSPLPTALTDSTNNVIKSSPVKQQAIFLPTNVVKEGEKRNLDSLIVQEQRKEKALSVYENVQQKESKPNNETQNEVIENNVEKNNTTWYEYGCV